MQLVSSPHVPQVYNTLHYTHYITIIHFISLLNLDRYIT